MKTRRLIQMTNNGSKEAAAEVIRRALAGDPVAMVQTGLPRGEALNPRAADNAATRRQRRAASIDRRRARRIDRKQYSF